MTLSLKLTIIILTLLLAYILYAVFRTRHYIAIGNVFASNVVPYEQHPPEPTLRILVVGDSTAAGTGADKPEDSVAGRLGAAYPTADITNLGVNGTKTHELSARLDGLADQRFDLLIIHTGGNDIVRFTNLDALERDLTTVLKKAKILSDTVIVLHGGNVGTAKLFPVGTRWIMKRRTAQVRDIFLRLAKEHRVAYVDLWRRSNDDPFFADPDSYYAKDYFHPSSRGYQDWYEHIAAVLNDMQFKK